MPLIYRTLLRFSLYLLLIGLISACGSISSKTDKLGNIDDLGEQIDSKQFEITPEQYLDMADAASGQQRYYYLLKAAELFSVLREFDAAEEQLRAIDIELASASQLRQLQIMSARIALGKGDPRKALALLQFSDILAPGLQAEVYKIRAKAFLDAGFPLEAAKTRIQLDTIILDPVDKEENHQLIWQTLSLLPETTLVQLSQAPLHHDFMGWVELAKVAKKGQIDWQHIQDGILKWRNRFPNHPAAKTFIQQLGHEQIDLMDRPSHIAVLLPFSGRYANIASTIREGFLSAYYKHPDQQLRPQISFIDTGSNPMAIWNHYRTAVEAGADFIVGPFVKTAVNSLAQSDEMEVPTLTLNYAQQPATDNELTDRLFQFGLLPEDEAQQTAEMAYRQGQQMATILVPEGEWGQRLALAFQTRFEELGGRIINSQTYIPGKNDFKRPIQELLNINESNMRHRRIQRILRTNLKFIPYRRQDVDMIFIAATPKDARQLKPQFKFHYAGELPVYATSHAFTGTIDSRADRDIDDLYYCDMPWILAPQTELNQALQSYWPDQKRYTRFFALGADAYNLIPFLGRLQSRSYERFSGQTGNLHLDQNNRIHRELLWAQFVRGVPTLIDINALPEKFALENSEEQ
ncbi:MAG: penicillin-binding protein activator [Gammaproteobacteria bacterium]